ncbi:MAG: valine--tRNA ligase [Planctomycetota bacterium]
MSRPPANLSLDSKHYDPALVEERTYALWEERGVFRADNTSRKPPYTIVIPPPNVTGRLHMGHALNNTIQDVLIRYKRMDGYDALWVPGTDHAGIATQTVVRKHLDAEGLDYQRLGREKFVERVWEWKQKYGDAILNQLRRLGCGCDWTRTRFTMDEGLSRAVRTAFKRLYDKGLVYRGKYIVNWCPVDRTALSDDEVETKDGGEPGFLWYFRYPLADGSGSLVIATTRPETMLGDTGVAVHPKDERYRHLVGRKVRLPLVGREIPIIADDYVDPQFGTGALKVTPAHDANDFLIGMRHGLAQVNVLNEDATMNDEVPPRFRGLDRFVCRDAVVQAMKEEGLLIKIEERMTPIGRSYRSKAVIEYRLCDQWFVKMRPLADAALAAVDAGKVRFVPERWAEVHRDWLVKTRDWCISRQIWWGHRIPAWYHRETGEILVDIETPERVRRERALWRQDEDVLDTWFSSALWPFSTLGWPEETPDLARYYPTDVLATAKDIIYFWVARMVMAGVEFMRDVPFHVVFINTTVCDEDGETMSKSKGNGIDPLHVISGATLQELEGPAREARPPNMQQMLERLSRSFPKGFEGVGADALRFTLLTLSSEAQQSRLSLERFDEIGRRFSNKLWNASRFALQSFAEIPPAIEGESEPLFEDRWILGTYDQCVRTVRASLDAYRFNEATDSLYHFFWGDLCDWYLELVKSRLREGSPAERRCVQMTLGEVLGGYLRLLHPFAPFITEEIWGHLQPKLAASELLGAGDECLAGADLIARAPFPVDRGRFDARLVDDFARLQEVVRAARTMRAHAGLTERTPVETRVRALDESMRGLVTEQSSLLVRAGNLKWVALATEKPRGMAMSVVPGAEVYINLAEHLDIDAELGRKRAELEKVEAYVAKIETKLVNASFVSRAPPQVIEAERGRLQEALLKRDRIKAAIEELRGAE